MTPIEVAIWRIKEVIKSLNEIPSATNCLAIIQLEKAIDDISGDSVLSDYAR